MSTPHPPRRLSELAASPIDDDDVRLLGQIGALYDALDPTPTGLTDRIRFGITLEALHAEIAELQRSADLVGVRSEEAATAQTITFTSASLTTMVTITPTVGDRARLDGWVAPAEAVDIELRLVGESRRAVADQDGRFSFDDVPRGLAQFVLRRSGTPMPPPVITPSIEL